MGARISVSVHLETWDGESAPTFEAEISGSLKRVTKSLAFDQTGDPVQTLPGILAEIENFIGASPVGN